MSLNPPKQFAVKISVLKISAKNLEGRKWGGGGMLFVSQTLQRVSSSHRCKERVVTGSQEQRGRTQRGK